MKRIAGVPCFVVLLPSIFAWASIALPALADVMGDCGPEAAVENPLFKEAREAREQLEASTAAAERRRELADRWEPLVTRQKELNAEAARDDAECRRLKALADGTLGRLQSCQAECDRSASSQSSYDACQACAGPVNVELAQREAEFVAFNSKTEPYNSRVLEWERRLKAFIVDVGRAIPRVIEKEVDRMVAILTDSPGIFVVADSGARSNPTPAHYIEYFEQVTKNADHINVAAARHHVDPDLVRAVIWMESTRGYYDSATGLVMNPKTILPMNVWADYWTGFKVTREGLQDPAINIDTGTKILARIQARVENGTVAKIATLYGNLAAHGESEYGKTVEYYYDTRPWLNR